MSADGQEDLVYKQTYFLYFVFGPCLGAIPNVRACTIAAAEDRARHPEGDDRSRRLPIDTGCESRSVNLSIRQRSGSRSGTRGASWVNHQSGAHPSVASSELA